jgi:hypothetical protein
MAPALTLLRESSTTGSEQLHAIAQIHCRFSIFRALFSSCPSRMEWKISAAVVCALARSAGTLTVAVVL